MSVWGNSIHTEGSAEMVEKQRKIENLSITMRKDDRIEYPSTVCVNVDRTIYKAFESDQNKETFQKILVKSELTETRESHFDYSTKRNAHCTNKNGNRTFCLKSENEIMWPPLSGFKVDGKSNDVLLNLIPKLKVKSEAKLGTDLLGNLESVSYAGGNPCIGASDHQAEVKKHIYKDISPGSNWTQTSYQTGPTVYASLDLGNKHLNPVVVLNRLSSSEISSFQANQDFSKTRSGDDQDPEEIRNNIKRIGRTSFHESKASLTHLSLKLFACSECDKAFRYKSALKMHCVTHKGLKLYTCKECGKSYGLKSTLNAHLVTHTGLKSFTCEECGKSFSCKGVLRRHMVTHADLKLYTCEECGKSFGLKGNLRKHLRIHDGLYIYACEKCRKSFRHKNSLKYHLMAHTGLNLYSCEECGKSFGDERKLRSHLITHTGIKLYTCEECGTSFSHKSNLRKHLITHTGIKEFTCEQCGKSYGYRNDLKRHLINHTGLKLYPCEECGKSYAQKQCLNSHLVTHTDIKLYTCEQCGKSFRYRSNLQRHLVTRTHKIAIV